MSAINGDKARFNRQRKHKIASRARTQERFLSLTSRPKSGTPAPETKAGKNNRKQVSA